MSERRLDTIIVIAIVVLMVAGIAAFIVWWHDGSQLPPGQDSMDSITPGVVDPIVGEGTRVRHDQPLLLAVKRPQLDKSECVKPPRNLRRKTVRCILGAAPLDYPKPLILVAPTPKSAR